ncbi:aldo/keto reductase [Pseudoalteromonas sp. T1lg75]|uniref:aldo/keto reductase n=1 Tax=Pseudoalteromonas sp. T1lg75 TaxID=2077102 RepID=UPI000CF6D6CD|nr:aldo/keto reductase [Pseudoalteromonas sp. T1lg75]
MDYAKLGRSGLKVSRVCLGTMTWGKQNTQSDADEQLNYALAQGVNFIDTAEMYAVPPSPDTYGKTEIIIGDWLSRHKEKRKELVLATKIAGNGLKWVRDGGDISKEAVIAAVDQSLKRLQTDYIDLFQLHWPNRTSPHFAKQWPGMVDIESVDKSTERAQMHAILEGLDTCVRAGKIRHCGLSNETPWGLSQYLDLAKQYSLPAMVSMQNEFSLVHGKDWPYLIEQCHHEDVAYLPWSPLAGGMLSGKYLGGARPAGSRWTIAQRNGLFRDTEQGQQAVARYQEIAKQQGITTAQLALAWCNQVQGVTSTIIGATSKAQLQENIDAFALTLNEETLAQIDAVFREYPAPY